MVQDARPAFGDHRRAASRIDAAAARKGFVSVAVYERVLHGFSEKNVLVSFESDFQTVGDHDVAVAQLNQEQTDQLSDFTPLEESSIATSKQTEESCFIELVGFPETKSRKVHGQNKIKGQIHGFGGTLIEATPERVRVKFSSKRAIDAKTRTQVTPPDPHGISGGAMFGIAMNEAAIIGTPVLLLVGISTDLPIARRCSEPT